MAEKIGRKDIFVSVVVPVYNSAACIVDFLQELHAILLESFDYFEIVIVDDGSSDGTGRAVDEVLARLECIRYLKLSRHCGTEIALSAGFDSAIGDYIVTMVPESDPCGMVPEMVSRAAKTGTVVLGRVPQKHFHPMYRFGYHLFHWAAGYVAGLSIKPNTTNFMAFSRTVLNALNQMKDSVRYVKAFAPMVGFQPYIVDYLPTGRGRQKEHLSLLWYINFALDLVVSCSTRPLRLVSLIALSLSGINLIYFGYIGLIALLKDHVAEGWITMSTQIAFGFFLTSLVLAALCEYAARILIESKTRPLYFTTDEKNSTVLISTESTQRNVVLSPTKQAG